MWYMQNLTLVSGCRVAAKHLSAGLLVPTTTFSYARNVRDRRNPITSGGAYTLSANPVFEMTLTLKARQNDWYYGKGVDLLFDPNVDSNLRAAIDVARVVKDLPKPHKVELRPKADGIVDFNQKNWNDWEGLGVDLCRDLKSAGANVNCLAWPFP
jgi:hypothetical protein